MSAVSSPIREIRMDGETTVWVNLEEKKITIDGLPRDFAEAIHKVIAVASFLRSSHSEMFPPKSVIYLVTRDSTKYVLRGFECVMNPRLFARESNGKMVYTLRDNLFYFGRMEGIEPPFSSRCAIQLRTELLEKYQAHGCEVFTFSRTW